MEYKLNISRNEGCLQVGGAGNANLSQVVSSALITHDHHKRNQYNKTRQTFRGIQNFLHLLHVTQMTTTCEKV